MTGAPRWDGTVSLGNVLVALAMVISGTLAWATNRERGISNAAEIVRLDAGMEDLELRVRGLETAGSASAGQLMALGDDIRELRSDVKTLIDQHGLLRGPR